MSHWGIPGPGGSLGKCAVCGDSFAAGVMKDLCGLPSGITTFSVGFIEQHLYAHDPECTEVLETAFAESDNNQYRLRDLLPDGPLRKALGEAIDIQETSHAQQ